MSLSVDSATPPSRVAVVRHVPSVTVIEAAFADPAALTRSCCRRGGPSPSRTAARRAAWRPSPGSSLAPSCPPSSPSPGAGSPALVRQRRHLGDVRVLRGELVDPGVDLGRVHVLRDEVLLERRDARREGRAGPLGRRRRVESPVAAATRTVMSSAATFAYAPRSATRSRWYMYCAGVAVESCCRRCASSPSGLMPMLLRLMTDDLPSGPAYGRHRRAGGVVWAVVRLDVEEAAGVVRERVRAHHDVSPGTGRRPRLGRLVDAVLGELGGARLALAWSRRSRPGALPRALVLDDLADRVALRPAGAPPRTRRGRPRPPCDRRCSRRRRTPRARGSFPRSDA